MQSLVVGMSAALAVPSLLKLVNHAEVPGRLEVSVERVDGPFEALKVDGGFAAGAILSRAFPGAHIAWVLQLSAHAGVALDLDTHLMRLQDQVQAAWSHRELFGQGPEPHTYLLEQALPADLKPGRYQIVQDVSLHGTADVHRQLPSLSIDVLATTGL